MSTIIATLIYIYIVSRENDFNLVKSSVFRRPWTNTSLSKARKFLLMQENCVFDDRIESNITSSHADNKQLKTKDVSIKKKTKHIYWDQNKTVTSCSRTTID